MHPVASSWFSAVFVFQVFRRIKVPKKFQKNYIKNFLDGSLQNNQSGAPGPLPATQEGGWRGPEGGGRQAPSWLTWQPPRGPPSPIKPPRGRNPETRSLFGGNPTVPPPPPFFRSELPKKLLRHPAGERSPLRETLHRHGRLPYVP